MKWGPTLAFTRLVTGRTLDKEKSICKECFLKLKYNIVKKILQSHHHSKLLSKTLATAGLASMVPEHFFHRIMFNALKSI